MNKTTISVSVGVSVWQNFCLVAPNGTRSRIIEDFLKSYTSVRNNLTSSDQVSDELALENLEAERIKTIVEHNLVDQKLLTLENLKKELVSKKEKKKQDDMLRFIKFQQARDASSDGDEI